MSGTRRIFAAGVASVGHIRILTRTLPNEDEGYDVAVPNKTIYVSDGDLPLFQRAQELAGGNLSAAIAKALRRWVDATEGLSEGFDDVVVRVGLGSGRKVRFTGVLVGEWMDTRARAAPSASGSTAAAPASMCSTWSAAPSAGWSTRRGSRPGWRGYLGIGDVKYGASPQESTLEVVATLDELRDKVPPELFEMVARSARLPTVEELDI